MHVHVHMHAPVFPWIGAGAQKTVSCRLALANKRPIPVDWRWQAAPIPSRLTFSVDWRW